MPTILTKNTVFELDGASGFLIENLGNADILAGPVGQEIIPVTSGQSRPFECPEGGIYVGRYSIKFGAGANPRALIVRNNPTDIQDGQESDNNQLKYRERIG